MQTSRIAACAALLLLNLPCPAEGGTFRGIWVDAWHPGFKSSAEVSNLVSRTREAHFNAILAQVRRRGDAFYRSDIVPATADTKVAAARFDSLKALIEARDSVSEAPKLEVHAWLVLNAVATLRMPSQENHVFNAHSNWLSQTYAGTRLDGVESGYWLDPGHPEVQRHLAAIVLELASRYDVDGVCLDYFRYPGAQWGYNPVAIERFNKLHGRKDTLPAPDDELWTKFRRDQLTALLRKIYLLCIDAKPSLKISVVGMTFSPPIGPSVQWEGTGTFKRSLQDWRAWAQEGIVDMVVPLVFFKTDTPERAEMFDHWLDFAATHSYERHVVVGTGNYMNLLEEGMHQMRKALSLPNAAGVVVYSYAKTSKETNTWEQFSSALRSVFPQAVGTPDMPWKSKPLKGHLKGIARGLPSSAPMDGATIHLLGPQNRSIVTDATGFYGFVDIEPGTYRVASEAHGFQAVTNSVEIAAGKVTTLNLAVTPAAGGHEGQNR
jgi:uncharacterized lipoprotein YddW (UPF0748 family)